MIILGTNSIKETGFNVANSCRFNSASNDHLNRTQTAGNRRKFTFSTWVKRCNPATRMALFLANRSSSNYDQFYLNEGGYIEADFYHSGTQIFRYKTNALYRDPSAWYHIILAVDTEHSTASSRVRIYVNGSEVTSFATETNPSQDVDTHVNENSIVAYIGSDYNSNEPDYYLAETVMLDGTQATPTSFGEFDEDSPTIWKPIDVSGLTFGTNGFYLDYEDSSALGNDVSGNNNDFTVNNLTAIDQSIDTCTNNFATLNPLDFYHNATANTGSTSSEGNLKFVITSGNKGFARSTFGVSAGKWYFEAETNAVGKGFYGVCNAGIMEDGTALQTSAVYYYENVPDFRSGDEIVTTNAVSVSAGSILGFALDMDNHALYISKDGTYMNSGDPGSGSSRTGAISEEFTDGRAVLSDYGPVFANVANTSTSGGLDTLLNFGSPPYSESGGNSDGNGYGNFKTAPPSGYLALCTKNLGSDGG